MECGLSYVVIVCRMWFIGRRLRVDIYENVASGMWFKVHVCGILGCHSWNVASGMWFKVCGLLDVV